MSLVALALVIGLAFCIERMIYLSLSEINAKQLMSDISDKVAEGDVEGAKRLCQESRGPWPPSATRGWNAKTRNWKTWSAPSRIWHRGGGQPGKRLQLDNALHRHGSSLGFLGTVIGMVMAFDQIQQAGDISPTIVASGMKVALITTIFGIIVALILQVFYNYILSKIDHLTSQMEESAITLLDVISKYQEKR